MVQSSKTTTEQGHWVLYGFDLLISFFDRIYRINGVLYACGDLPLGRRPFYPDDPVNPVCYVY